ncbi:MAG: hypothetical protein L0H64_00030 [Pseudonocardia sp.]|nr:hypothetical protein [Pseudonocardia sp.]
MIWLLPAFPVALTLLAVGLHGRATALFGDVVHLHARPRCSVSILALHSAAQRNRFSPAPRRDGQEAGLVTPIAPQPNQ